MRLHPAVAFLTNVLLATALDAQQVSGSMRGRVVEGTNGPAPAAHVAVSGRDLLGTRTATTNDDGYFQIVALPPGEYTVRVTRVGMRPVVVERVTVLLGRTTPVGPVRLEAQPVQLDEVRVTAGRYSLDPTHTDVGATLTAADYSLLPGDRDYKSIISILPHVNQSSRGDPVNVAGATGLENMYFIDGVNVTAPLKGETGTSLPYNFVKAIEVKTGGYEAQYGKALGAVVNAVTYSGTNDFEVSTFGFTTTSDLSATPKSLPTLRERSAMSYDVGVRVGGPLIRDRLWYSAAYNPRVERADREIPTLGVFTDTRTAQIFAGKLNVHAGAATDIELSVFGDPTVHRAIEVHNFAPAHTPLNADPYSFRRESGGIVGSLRLTTTLRDRLLIEASLARSSGNDVERGATDIGQNEALLVDHVANTLSGGAGFKSTTDMERSAVMMRGTAAWGRHTTVLGAEYEDIEATRRQRISGGFFVERYSWGYLTTVDDGSGRFRNRTPTWYVQDSWQINERVALNAGMRLSSQTLYGNSGRVAQRFPNEWQPRLGFVWQPDAAKRQRVFGSAGRFYQQIPLNLSTLWYLDWAYVNSFYSVDPRQPGVVPDSTDDYTTFEIDWAKQIPGLKVEHTDEFSLGYERLVGNSTKFTARIIRRELRSSFQWGINQAGSFVLGTPGKGTFDFLPRPRREYTALELGTEGAWRNLAFRSSYVLSRNWGNYSGLHYSDLGFQNPGGNGTFFIPEHAVNSTGWLPNDRTHMLKVAASHRAGFGVTTGTVLSWESGSPLNVFGASGNLFRPVFLQRRGSAGRTPSLWDLNLRLAYDAPATRSARSRLLLDVLHIGNPQRPTRIGERQFSAIINGVQSDPDPSYGRALAFQRPMMARLGLEVGF